MTESLEESTWLYLVTLARKSPAREICGFVMKDWVVLPIDNVADGDREFYMDEDQLIHIYTHHRDDIVGIYHSHPSGVIRPSDADMTFARRDMRYWIVTVAEVAEWRFEDGISSPTAKLVNKIRVPAAEVRQAPVANFVASGDGRREGHQEVQG